MIRTILIASILLLGGCSLTGGGEPVQVQVAKPAACDAMAPDMPIMFHGGKTGLGGGPGEDRTDTVQRIKLANARYTAICK